MVLTRFVTTEFVVITTFCKTINGARHPTQEHRIQRLNNNNQPWQPDRSPFLPRDKGIHGTIVYYLFCIFFIHYPLTNTFSKLLLKHRLPMGACPCGGIGNAEGMIVCVFFVPLCFIYLILFPVVFSVLWRARQGAVGDRGAGEATKFEEAKGWGETNTGGKLMARSRARPGTWGGGGARRGNCSGPATPRRDESFCVFFHLFNHDAHCVLSLSCFNQSIQDPAGRGVWRADQQRAGKK